MPLFVIITKIIANIFFFRTTVLIVLYVKTCIKVGVYGQIK